MSQERRDSVRSASFLGGGVEKIAFAQSRRLVLDARGVASLARSAKQKSLVRNIQSQDR